MSAHNVLTFHICASNLSDMIICFVWVFIPIMKSGNVYVPFTHLSFLLELKSIESVEVVEYYFSNFESENCIK